MSEKLSCPVVRDLLPLYLDNLVSQETAEEIRLHLEDCPDCRSRYTYMKEALPEEEKLSQEEAKKEINYLRKIRSHSLRRTLLYVAAVLAAGFLILLAKLFLIGSPSEAYAVTYLNTDEEAVHVGGVFVGSALVYNRYEIKEGPKGSRLVLYSCLPSPWNRSGAFNLDIPLEKFQDSLDIRGNTVTKEGAVISAIANRLYENRNPYVGDASADGRLTQTLEIGRQLGEFTNELQTSREPYGWTLHFTDSVRNSAVFDEKMRGFACALIALTDNLGSVSWDYTVELEEGSVTRSRTMTEADCSEALGSPVKRFAESPEEVQSLLDEICGQYGLSYTIE